MDEYEGVKCYKNIASLPDNVTGIVINTKPETTKSLLEEVKTKALKTYGYSRGHDKETISNLPENDTNIITKECIMMFAGEVKGIHGFHKWLKKSFGTFPK
ncbi:MAG: hypothetical protein R2764_04345 [Bacteroidales bacterium]